MIHFSNVAPNVAPSHPCRGAANIPVCIFASSLPTSRIPMALETLSVALALVVAAALWRWSRRRRLPPGPKRWPLLGSFLSFPRYHVYDAFGRWQKAYGEPPTCILSFAVRTSSQCLQVMWYTSVSLGSRYTLSIRERKQKSSSVGVDINTRTVQFGSSAICKVQVVFLDLHFTHSVCLGWGGKVSRLLCFSQGRYTRSTAVTPSRVSVQHRPQAMTLSFRKGSNNKY